jgi:hypothetical protein
MPLHLHERIDIEGGARGRMIELLRTRLAPHLAKAYGVRLFGVWATVGSTGEWPEVRVQWEFDDWAHFARVQGARYPLEERDLFGLELWMQALDFRRHGHASVLVPAAFSPGAAALSAGATLRSAGATLQGAGTPAPQVILHEEVKARPGKLGAYHAALQSRFLPIAAKHGLALVGAYSNAYVPNTGVNLWALRDWAHWKTLLESESADIERGAWTAGLGEWLEDLDGFCVVPPPEGVLRT